MSSPYRSVYYVTPEVVEWMNQKLSPVEESVFYHWRGVLGLVEIVDLAEAGRIPKYAALSAIRNYNEEHDTDVSFEEIRGRHSDYIFSDFGEWVVYTDNQEPIVFGEHDSPEDALTFAPESVGWIIVWLPQEGELVIYRSPHLGRRTVPETHFEWDTRLYVDGTVKGDELSYVLPPDIEAAMGTLQEGEILQPDHNTVELWLEPLSF
jgi:hypothetical protein